MINPLRKQKLILDFRINLPRGAMLLTPFQNTRLLSGYKDAARTDST